ncbi:MAG: phosphatidate cytidylyltransferase [Gemmatimonadetes bacterium]|nr:phosphatidate cytidylyltransferase [Gemmatimonadota bacterium]
MASSLPRRIAVAAVGIPTAVGVVYLGHWWLVALTMLLGLAGTREFYALAEKAGAQPLAFPGYLGAVLLPVAAYVITPAGGTVDPLWIVLAAPVWLLVTLAYATASTTPGRQTLASVAITVVGPLYAAGLLASLLVLRHGGSGLSASVATAWVFLPIVTTWLCDTAAMTVGSAFRGPQLAPVISPNKTWSGAAAGLVGAALVTVAYGRFVLAQVGVALPVWQLLIVGLTVGIFGQMGDLVESSFKRSVAVKDSGAFFPGHGGVLDRLDSLYWVLPLSALWFHVFGVL